MILAALYHWSPADQHDSIRQHGLVPGSPAPQARQKGVGHYSFQAKKKPPASSDWGNPGATPPAPPAQPARPLAAPATRDIYGMCCHMASALGVGVMGMCAPCR